jgi:hypothetical protein
MTGLMVRTGSKCPKAFQAVMPYTGRETCQEIVIQLNCDLARCGDSHGRHALVPTRIGAEVRDRVSAVLESMGLTVSVRFVSCSILQPAGASIELPGHANSSNCKPRRRLTSSPMTIARILRILHGGYPAAFRRLAERASVAHSLLPGRLQLPPGLSPCAGLQNIKDPGGDLHATAGAGRRLDI